MKKSAFLIMAGIVLVVSTVAWAVTPAEAPETIKIEDCMNKKTAVEFPHKAHWEYTECTTCHHAQEGLTKDTTEEVQPCSACHVDPEDAAVPACDQMSLTKNPFHITCVGCHKDQKKEDPETKAPTTCNQCHVKE